MREKDSRIDCLISPRVEEIISLLSRYIDEIGLFNRAYGLVGAKDSEELTVKHILDSIAPLGIIIRLLDQVHAKDAVQMADAGSGAGLPGIPLAIAMPDCGVTLIERMGRRAGFLWNVKAALNLSNVTVEEGELEKTRPGSFNLLTFRAFKPLEPKLLSSLFKACADGGIIAAYKGRREKTEEEIKRLTLKNKEKIKWEIVPYSVPFLDEERNMLIIGL